MRQHVTTVMNTLKKNELYQHLQEFLSKKGIELSGGGVSKGIKQGCELLTDAINVTQHAVGKAKTEVDTKLERMRQAIHKKTAPRSQTSAPPKPDPRPDSKPAKKRTGKRRTEAKPAAKKSTASPKPRTVVRKAAKAAPQRKRAAKKTA